MAEVKRAISSRRGYRAHLKKILKQVDECLSSTTPFTADDIATLKDLHEQLTRKDSLITPLHTKILESLDNDEELKAEIVQTEEVASSISCAKTKITHCLTLHSAEAITNGHDDTPPSPLRLENLLHSLASQNWIYHSSQATHSIGRHFGTASRQP